jgi:hypothetical protein
MMRQDGYASTDHHQPEHRGVDYSFHKPNLLIERKTMALLCLFCINSRAAAID